MAVLYENAIRRRIDGSMDVDFYARRAALLRTAAKTKALKRLASILRRVAIQEPLRPLGQHRAKPRPDGCCDG